MGQWREIEGCTVYLSFIGCFGSTLQPKSDKIILLPGQGKIYDYQSVCDMLPAHIRVHQRGECQEIVSNVILTLPALGKIPSTVMSTHLIRIGFIYHSKFTFNEYCSPDENGPVCWSYDLQEQLFEDFLILWLLSS